MDHIDVIDQTSRAAHAKGVPPVPHPEQVQRANRIADAVAVWVDGENGLKVGKRFARDGALIDGNKHHMPEGHEMDMNTTFAAGAQVHTEGAVAHLVEVMGVQPCEKWLQQ